MCEWLAKWLHDGAVPVATLNQQQIYVRADAWHHQVRRHRRQLVHVQANKKKTNLISQFFTEPAYSLNHPLTSLTSLTHPLLTHPQSIFAVDVQGVWMCNPVERLPFAHFLQGLCSPRTLLVRR